VSESTDTRTTWLSKDDIETYRARMPVVYVDAVPVRVDANGTVTRVGTLLGMQPDGSISRAVISGRILYGERVRDALVRHLEKDLGPVALPHIPPSPAPFTVVEYFPDPDITGFHDPRQHAVSLAFVVPVAGDCAPQNDSLDLTWFSPDQALDPGVQAEMDRGHGVLLRQALAHLGHPV
jgi:ADP-ribose pyrophosphatase YjhB (NUDIX family)